jgi:hypothetical protein
MSCTLPWVRRRESAETLAAQQHTFVDDFLLHSRVVLLDLHVDYERWVSMLFSTGCAMARGAHILSSASAMWAGMGAIVLVDGL